MLPTAAALERRRTGASRSPRVLLVCSSGGHLLQMIALRSAWDDCERTWVTLRAPDFRLDVEALRAAVTPRTTSILLNTPHNPTGAMLTAAELRAVADVAQDELRLPVDTRVDEGEKVAFVDVLGLLVRRDPGERIGRIRLVAELG